MRETRTFCDKWNNPRKCSMVKQREKMLDGLTKWLKVGRVTDALKVTTHRDVWKVMITYAKGQDT